MAAPVGRCVGLVAATVALAGCLSDPAPTPANESAFEESRLRPPRPFLTVVESRASAIVPRERGRPGHAFPPVAGATAGANGDGHIAFGLSKQFPLVVHASIAWQNDADLDIVLARRVRRSRHRLPRPGQPDGGAQLRTGVLRRPIRCAGGRSSLPPASVDPRRHLRRFVVRMERRGGDRPHGLIRRRLP